MNLKKGPIGAIFALISVFLMIYIMVAGINYFGYSVLDRVQKDGFVNIPTNSTVVEVSAVLVDNGFIKDSSDYQTYARMMRKETVYPGRYKLAEGMSFKDIIIPIATGTQTPTKITFTPTYNLGSIANKISTQIEADSTSIMTALRNDSIQKIYNMTDESITMMLIPNTYEVYWNTTAEQFFARMHKEYNKFWEPREAKLKELGMTRLEVMTIASIVFGETQYTPEMPTVAGVYVNRIKDGIKLQADPTIVYAHQDFTMRRVLRKHLTIDSPYNTYKYEGLPPGPINVPSISAIDAVLNYKKHKYLFFCASERLDGTHNFAISYNTHLRNARLYTKKLNELGIKK